MKSPDTILITGGCGFLGTNLGVHGLEQEKKIIVADNLSRTGSEKNLSFLKQTCKSENQLEYANIDIRDEEAVLTLVKKYKPDSIFHLSGPKTRF
jgi:CDP-paratose 2-epimerase